MFSIVRGRRFEWRSVNKIKYAGHTENRVKSAKQVPPSKTKGP